MHDEKNLRALLTQVQSGAVDLDEAMARLKQGPTEALGFATLDRHRALRQGFPEVIYGEGKNDDDLATLVATMAKGGQPVLATRVAESAWVKVKRKVKRAVYHPRSRAVIVEAKKAPAKQGLVLVFSAGTSDIPVAEEAALTASVMGSNVETVFDVGVAGIHRLSPHLPRLAEARAVVVAAGMDGALASVIGGLAPCPVVGLPTSIGYGAAFGGVSALLAMLNACAAGVGVVNIDNGFGAGALAHKINMAGEPR